MTRELRRRPMSRFQPTRKQAFMASHPHRRASRGPRSLARQPSHGRAQPPCATRTRHSNRTAKAASANSQADPSSTVGWPGGTVDAGAGRQWRQDDSRADRRSCPSQATSRAEGVTPCTDTNFGSALGNTKSACRLCRLSLGTVRPNDSEDRSFQSPGKFVPNPDDFGNF